MNVLITTLSIYLIFIITIKVTSARKLAALNVFDVATLALTIALIENTISSGSLEAKGWSLFSMIALAFFNHAVSKTKISIPDKRVPLILNGDIKYKEVKKHGMHIDTIWSILRENDIVNLASVRAMYIESMGNISVWKHDLGIIDPISKLPLSQPGVESYILRLMNTGSSYICIVHVGIDNEKDALIKKRTIEDQIRFDDRIYIDNDYLVVVLNTSHAEAFKLSVKWKLDVSIKEIDIKLKRRQIISGKI